MKKNNTFTKGLSIDKIKKISQIKNEPHWMRDIRLHAYSIFNKLKNPSWGPKLNFINFSDYIYYSSPVDSNVSWNDVPKKIKNTFKRLNISQEHAKTLSGNNAQYDSMPLLHSMDEELKKKGVIFTSIENAISIRPDLVKKYFGKLVGPNDNKFAALNTSVWSGGTFLYVPKNVHIDMPLQAYFRINTKSVGQFERTLIIADEGSSFHYNEGCTAPIYDKNNLHAAVVEVFILKNAHVRYSTIQNWSDNVLNLVTKRAICYENAKMEWVDGNLGSKLNMKYPCTILKGDNSSSSCISIATAKKGVIQDSGAKMIHLGNNTRSQIISKSISHHGGEASYRGLVKISNQANNSYAEVKCDSLLLDKISSAKTIPTEIIENNSSFIKHEAKTLEIDKEKEFYLLSKGIDKESAKHLLVVGFVSDFIKELPMEYGVELNRLLSLEIK